MKLSTNFGRFSMYGTDRGLELCKNAGFDAIDFDLGCLVNDDNRFNGGDYLEIAENFRKKVEGMGLEINQTHAPFNFRTAQWKDPEYYENVIYPRTVRSLEISAAFGAKIAVVHPLHHFTYHGHEEEIFEKNMEFYRSLIPYCREYGVKVGIENMYQMDYRRNHIILDTCGRKEEFIRYIDTLDSEYMVATLDIGHVGLPLQDDEPWDFIRALGHDRLKSLHVHDNDYRTDSHIMPFWGKIDWLQVTKALGEIDYDGDFTYEVGNHGNSPDAFLQTTINYFADIGRFLMGEIDRNRIAQK